MPVNDEWQAIPPFEASLGEIIKLFECPHCHMWVKRMPVICPNCNKYCGRPVNPDSALFRTKVFNFHFIKFIHNERKKLKKEFYEIWEK